MKRRVFIWNGIAASALLGASGFSFGCSDRTVKHLTILHTNDVHSHIDPFGPDSGRNANKGGVSRRATIIESIRSQNPNTLLLDAGDIFQGTPYFNYYGGELELKLMSMLGYDAATIGNHEFDNGINGLLAQLPNANFELLSANYDFKNTALDTFIPPYKVFNKNDIKVGVFGLGIQLNGLVDPNMYLETTYLDPVEIAQDMTRILKEEEACDLIICLSHLGYDYPNLPDKVSDLSLARSTKDIDLIIGGHTHTFLQEPTLVTNSVGQTTAVNQVGCYGLHLGRIDFYWNYQGQKTFDSSSLII